MTVSWTTGKNPPPQFVQVCTLSLARHCLCTTDSGAYSDCNPLSVRVLRGSCDALQLAHPAG